MKSAIAQFVGLVKAAAGTLRLFCPVCNVERPHAFRPAGSWEEYICPTCGNVQAFKVR